MYWFYQIIIFQKVFKMLALLISLFYYIFSHIYIMTVTYLYYEVCNNSCQHKVLSDEIHYNKQK